MEPEKRLVIVAGNCGVYVGLMSGGASSWDGVGAVRLTSARHLRRYVVQGKKGDGSVSDLAQLGLDPSSPSVSVVVSGQTVLGGVFRVLDVANEISSSFGLTK